MADPYALAKRLMGAIVSCNLIYNIYVRRNKLQTRSRPSKQLWVLHNRLLDFLDCIVAIKPGLHLWTCPGIV